jgi:hypothetical protein
MRGAIISTVRHAAQHWGALAEHVVIGYDQPNAFIRDASCTDSDLALISAGVGLSGCHVAIARRDGLLRVLSKAFALQLETLSVDDECVALVLAVADRPRVE